MNSNNELLSAHSFKSENDLTSGLDQVESNSDDDNNDELADAFGQVKIDKEVECDDIYEAAKKGSIVELQQFLNKEEGANLNSVNEEGDLPLHLACRSGCLDVVQLLVKKKAEVNARNKEGNRPLHFAVKSASLNIVEFLVKSGAQINATNNKNELVLVWANDNDVINLLINKGANYEYINEEGKNTLYLAAELNNEILVQNLLNRFEVDAIDFHGEATLKYAVNKGNWNVIEILQRNGAYINDRSYTRETILHYAACSGHFQVVEKLLQDTSNVDPLDSDNCTPLMYAAERGHVEIVKLLLSHGANAELRNYFDQTALDYAANNEIVWLLELELEREYSEFDSWFNKGY